MEFGHLSDEELAAIDFTLPPDSPFTSETLKSAGSNNGFNMQVGLSKWQHKTWTGKLFPPKTDPKDFLSIYAKSFDTIEFNATFYTIYSKEDTGKWNAQLGRAPGFTFCPKFPQTITHIRRLRNAKEQTDKFYDSFKGLHGHLGPAFIQVGDNFTHKSFPELKDYLLALPKEPKVFLEVRHKEWFSNPGNRHLLFGMMRDTGIGTIITDAAGRRDCVHMELTQPEVMIRFVANSKHPTDYLRLNSWIERLKEWKAKGLRSAWFFIHSYDETFAPEIAKDFIQKLNTELHLSLKVPQLL
jgi:uncharacterized protein YecE (DUF72 family)